LTFLNIFTIFRFHFFLSDQVDGFNLFSAEKLFPMKINPSFFDILFLIFKRKSIYNILLEMISRKISANKSIIILLTCFFVIFFIIIQNYQDGDLFIVTIENSEKSRKVGHFCLNNIFFLFAAFGRQHWMWWELWRPRKCNI